MVNRAIPDAELDQFVAEPAGKIAGSDRRVLAEAKALVDRATLPANEDLVTAYEASSRR